MSHVTVVEVEGRRWRKGSSVLVVSRTLTERFDGRVPFYDVSLTGSLKRVCVLVNICYILDWIKQVDCRSHHRRPKLTIRGIDQI